MDANSPDSRNCSDETINIRSLCRTVSSCKPQYPELSEFSAVLLMQNNGMFSPQLLLDEHRYEFHDSPDNERSIHHRYRRHF